MYIFKPVVNSGKHHRMITSPTYILPPCHLPDSGTETNGEQFGEGISLCLDLGRAQVSKIPLIFV